MVATSLAIEYTGLPVVSYLLKSSVRVRAGMRIPYEMREVGEVWTERGSAGETPDWISKKAAEATMAPLSPEREGAGKKTVFDEVATGEGALA